MSANIKSPTWPIGLTGFGGTDGQIRYQAVQDLLIFAASNFRAEFAKLPTAPSPIQHSHQRASGVTLNTPFPANSDLSINSNDREDYRGADALGMRHRFISAQLAVTTA